jgi:hypothetical protein
VVYKVLGQVIQLQLRSTGDNNAVDIRQIGSTNTLSLGVTATTATGRAYGIDLTYYVTGNSGTAVINSNNVHQVLVVVTSLTLDKLVTVPVLT